MFIKISLTNKCNKNCAYCPVKTWRGQPDTMSFSDIKQFIDMYGDEILEIELTGGEPTLWKDFDLLDEYFYYKTNNKVVVKSNGRVPTYCYLVSAWHDEFPCFYDTILIIDGSAGSEDKIKFCKENDIPYCTVSYSEGGALHDVDCHEITKQLFIDPNGTIRQCEGMGITTSGVALGYIQSLHFNQVVEGNNAVPQVAKPLFLTSVCNVCKSYNDYKNAWNVKRDVKKCLK